MVMITLGPANSRLLERIVAPAAEPLSLAEAKLYLRVDGSDEDVLISDLIASARIIAEQWLRRSLISQTWKLAFDHGVEANIWLPMGPILDIASVSLVDMSGNVNVLSADQYWLNAARDQLQFYGELMSHRVEIIYHAGYPLQKAIYLLLHADTELMGLITGVFDRVIQGTAFPYVSIGVTEGQDWSSMTHNGMMYTLWLEVWSREGGHKQAALIMTKIHSILHDSSPAVEGQNLVSIRYLGSSITLLDDGSTYRGAMRFKALLHA